MQRLRRLLRTLFVIALVGLVTAAALDYDVARDRGRVYSAADLPPREVGLVLGTAPKVAGGRRNLHFEGRIDLAARLYGLRKVKRLLVSGDNHTRGYDEPTAMKNALLARGVPEAAITLDYAGFRTLDSVARAKSVFGCERLVAITDDFHLPRTLYLCDAFGIDAIGCAADTSEFLRPNIRLREHVARVLAVLDVHVLGREPHFPK